MSGPTRNGSVVGLGMATPVNTVPMAMAIVPLTHKPFVTQKKKGSGLNVRGLAPLAVLVKMARVLTEAAPARHPNISFANRLEILGRGEVEPW